VEHRYNENLKEFETKMLMIGADPAWWADRFPKLENSKMVWNYRELITRNTELMLGQVTIQNKSAPVSVYCRCK